ncbi:fimbria/pilus outer membrane usher protein [Burkholderia stagnalis]|uniref:fimbria/pilus outer membrane usher protein n=1 Tax=Burkholderia stagnalis TaxID=1503054 RepID=UPI000759F978|nr:fimbria/pilus outer membrane usher protein [Burkholderia stagnalis]KWH29305.1 fimbrial assembly protein [Burkholderia stagnalis]KWH60261.1 fimbrial assembly protein [Burkholderia stagnalis]
MQRKYQTALSLPLRPCALVACALFACTEASANDTAGAVKSGEVEFNDLFLQQRGATRVDVSRYNKGNVASPGTYRTDIFVNQSWLGRADVTLRQRGASSDDVQPCFDRALLDRIGVDLSKLSKEAQASIDNVAAAGAGACLTLPELVPDATAQFDNGEQRLDISVPQASMIRNAREYVDPRYWDEGVPAALLKYDANVYRTDTAGMSSTQVYTGLTLGANMGPWRFRHTGSLSYNSTNGSHYQSIQTNVARSITRLKGQFVVGDAYTNGTIFDSVGFRGAQLVSDDRMYPESQRGYAPTVHGMANSNALVKIRQNGNVIYETNVAAGAFVIDDLYPTGYGGDLEVEVTEADGSKHVSHVPYAAPVNALRPGSTRYSFTVGKYRNQQLSESPLMFEGTVTHGFTNALTAYGGIQAADGYLAGALGASLNTELGAVGLDVTQSNTRLPNQPNRSGQSVRITYSKLLAPTNTNITVAAYRYSSSGFLSLQDAAALRDLAGRGMTDHMLTSGVQRGRLQLTVNQSLPQGYGSFYLSGSTQDYWNRDGRDTQFQGGYNNNFKRINYGVSMSRQFDLSQRKWNNTVMLTVSLPLGRGIHAPYSSTNVQRDSRGVTQVQQSLSGALGEDNALTYGVNIGSTGGGSTRTTTNVAGNVAYMSPVVSVKGSASAGTGYKQYGAGVSGGIVAYGGGIAFSPQLGETVAIVEAKGANGARVTNGAGLRVDPWGHAVVSSLRPFAKNDVEIDPKGLPLSVELKSTSQYAVPTAGAVVRLKFETEGGGRSAIIRAKTADGQPLPFGAQVFDASNQEVGTVAQAGRIIVRSMKSDSGEFSVKWGDGVNAQCRMSIVLPKAKESDRAPWTVVDSVCAP